jgi:hypothetical protein
MRSFLSVLLFLPFFIGIGQAAGQEVELRVGETYTEDGLTVRCVERTPPRLIVLTDCQYWDRYDQECLYERKRYHFGELECVEQCEQWDNFENQCYFATTCEFLPDQRAFLLTSCDVFDDVEKVCRRTKQQLIQ